MAPTHGDTSGSPPAVRLTGRPLHRLSTGRSHALVLGLAVVALLGSPAVVAYAAFTNPKSVTMSASTYTLLAPSAAPTGSCTNRVATLSWNAVTKATSYNVIATTEGVTSQVATGVTGTNTTVSGLTKNNFYTFQVRAANAGWTGPISAATASMKC